MPATSFPFLHRKLETARQVRDAQSGNFSFADGMMFPEFQMEPEPMYRGTGFEQNRFGSPFLNLGLAEGPTMPMISGIPSMTKGDFNQGFEPQGTLGFTQNPALDSTVLGGEPIIDGRLSDGYRMMRDAIQQRADLEFDMPERERIGTTEAAIAGGIGILGALFGADTADQSVANYIGNRQALIEQDFQEAFQAAQIELEQEQRQIESLYNQGQLTIQEYVQEQERIAAQEKAFMDRQEFLMDMEQGRADILKTAADTELTYEEIEEKPWARKMEERGMDVEEFLANLQGIETKAQLEGMDEDRKLRLLDLSFGLMMAEEVTGISSVTKLELDIIEDRIKDLQNTASTYRDAWLDASNPSLLEPKTVQKISEMWPLDEDGNPAITVLDNDIVMEDGSTMGWTQVREIITEPDRLAELMNKMTMDTRSRFIKGWLDAVESEIGEYKARQDELLDDLRNNRSSPKTLDELYGMVTKFYDQFEGRFGGDGDSSQDPFSGLFPEEQGFPWENPLGLGTGSSIPLSPARPWGLGEPTEFGPIGR